MKLIVEEILFHSAEQLPHKEAVRDSASSVTYADLAAQVRTIGRRLVAAGLTKGGRCAIILPNSINFLRVHFGVIHAGGISVPCEANISQATLTQILENSSPDIVILTISQWLRLMPVLSSSKFKIIVLQEGGKATPEKLPLAPMAVWECDLLDEKPVHISAEDDIATLMYTTGSTGFPKGVILSHSNVLHAIRSICKFIGYTAEDREVITLPLSHNFGLGHAYCNLTSGGAIALENGLSRVGRVLGTLENFQATGFPGTPLGFGLLIDRYSAILKEKGRSLRFIVVNSAALPPERTHQIQNLFPQVNLHAYYGLTEASRSCFISLSKSGPNYYNSVGRPMPHVEMKIADPMGHSLPPGQNGEILIKGDSVTRGYWNQPEETRRALRDSWLYTGDLGIFDEKGFLFLSGRLKDLINVGGYKVSPGEVESVLIKFPGILDVGVVGLDRLPGLASEAVVAAVVNAPNVPFDAVNCQKFCMNQLEQYKVPTRFFKVDQIPRSDSGKIKRQELSNLLHERFCQ